jgi:UDP-N-acetylmuramyl pentapeptide phosphotransferase/UDP-N-acetylglucosamine-1-phosphate transferase
VRRRGRVPAALAGAALARGYLAALTARPPGGAQRWQQTNYAGRPVSRIAGPALGAAVLTTLPSFCSSARVGVASAVAVAGATASGVYDDLRGDTSSRGLAGHGAELLSGHVTTGALKVVVLGTGGVLAGALLRDNWRDALIAGAVVAGSANVVNLLDLRPGRASKFALLPAAAAMCGPGAGTVAAAAGAAAALLPAELSEQVMLGDGGAGALGAAVGVGVAAAASPRMLRVALAVVSSLVVASEFVSFSRVIDRVPWLRALDRLGRAHDD